MLDYEKWIPWLQSEASNLQNAGLEVHLRFDKTLDEPKLILEIAGKLAVGSFENWARGATDYTVMAPPTPDMEMVAHKWGAIADNMNFETLFFEFVEAFHRANSSS